MDTIFAQATAPGRAGVSIVRVSGPEAWYVAEALTSSSLPAERDAAFRKFQFGGKTLDAGLLLIFPEGGSFTGERIAEFHLHGSKAVLDAITLALTSLGARLAEPGEFTRRALYNGKLDLAQVEGLAALIDAETEAQRTQALRVLRGDLSTFSEGVRQRLLTSLALVETLIDFADEEVPTDTYPAVTVEMEEVLTLLRNEVSGGKVRERLREGFEVAIIGAPNAGKSTLLNAIAGREVAITSSIPGTTRDVLEVRCDLDGLPVTILDTAGIRVATDQIEILGIERASKRAAEADLRIFLADLNGVLVAEHLRTDRDLVYQGKGDIVVSATLPSVSGITGAGIERLLAEITDELGSRVSASSLAIDARQRAAFASAIRSTERALQLVVTEPASCELIAEEIRGSLNSLDMLIGRIGVEEVLGEIFSRFCIGK